MRWLPKGRFSSDGVKTLLHQHETWLSFLLAVVAIFLWFPFYWPTVAVRASSQTVDPTVGMPLSFSIENTGLLNAHSPTYRCYYQHVVGAFVMMKEDYTDSVSIGDVLLPKDPVDITCPHVGVPVTEADVAILVSFRPSFDWRRTVACGRYVLHHTSDQKLLWLRKSSGPCAKLAACLDHNAREMQKYEAQLKKMFKSGDTLSQRPSSPKLISCLPQ
jgi:hypothetical protein